MSGIVIRRLEIAEVEPYIPVLLEDGFAPDVGHGVWLGGFRDGELAGFLRLFDEGGSWMIEDVWIRPEHREHGVATALIASAREGIDHVWLICDDEMTAWYERRGFVLAGKPDFPEPLATLYRAKSEWPSAPDHNHNALVWRAAP